MVSLSEMYRLGDDRHGQGEDDSDHQARNIIPAVKIDQGIHSIVVGTAVPIRDSSNTSRLAACRASYPSGRSGEGPGMLPQPSTPFAVALLHPFSIGALRRCRAVDAVHRTAPGSQVPVRSAAVPARTACCPATLRRAGAANLMLPAARGMAGIQCLPRGSAVVLLPACAACCGVR